MKNSLKYSLYLLLLAPCSTLCLLVYLQTTSPESRVLSLTLLSLTIVLVLSIGLYVSQLIVKPLTELTRALDKLSSGELSFRIPDCHFHELQKVCHSFNRMCEVVSEKLQKKKQLNLLLEDLVVSSVTLGNESIATEDVNSVLQSILEKSRSLTNADYGALGIGTNPHAPFKPWIFSGINEDLKNLIGRNPRPLGLLGWVARNGKSLRIPDLNSHSLFNGFPLHHPSMGPLLGVPILFKGLSIGNIYLARSAGGEEFSEQDQQIISLLSSQVGVILENFRLNSVLQRAITARDNTLAIVSHDLKSPLSSITLGAQVLQRKTSNNPEFEFLNRTLQNMNNSTSIMKALISDLLDAAAIESGKIQINLDIFPIADLLENLRGQFQQLSESKKIKLEVQYPKDEIKFSVTLLGSSRC